MSNSKNLREQSLPPAHDVPAWLALALLSTACFCLILAPTRLVPILTEMAAERRMYLPLAALVALVVIGGYSLLTRLAANSNARWTIAAVGALTLMLGLVYGVVSASRLPHSQRPGRVTVHDRSAVRGDRRVRKNARIAA